MSIEWFLVAWIVLSAGAVRLLRAALDDFGWLPVLRGGDLCEYGRAEGFVLIF